eukprot:20321-Hanusia_phi.AAC.2
MEGGQKKQLTCAFKITSPAVSNLGAYITRINEKKDVNAIKSLSFDLFSGEWRLLQTVPRIKDEIVCHDAMNAMKQHLENYSDRHLELDPKQFTDICEFCLRFCKFGSSQTRVIAHQLLGQCLGAKISSRQASTDVHNDVLIRVCKFAVEELFDSHVSKTAILLSEAIEVCNRLCILHPHVLDSCIMQGKKTAYEYYRNALSSHMRAAKTSKATAGCLSGMIGLMKHFRFKSIEESSAELMKECAENVWNSLKDSSKLERYEIVKASLKLVGEYATDLAKHLIKIANAPSICEALLRWCKHSNREVRSAALSAFDTWTSQAKEYIQTAEEVEILNKIYKDIKDEYQKEDEFDLKRISLSFRGRGSLAWQAAFYEMNILSDFLTDSLWFWNLLLSEQNGEEEDEIYEILPEFAISIANILMNMPVSACPWQQAIFEISKVPLQEATENQDCSWFISDIIRHVFSSYPLIMSKKRFLHERAWFLLQFSIIKSSARILSSGSFVPVALTVSIEPKIDEEHAAPGKSVVSDQKEQPCFTTIHLWTSILNAKHVEWIKRNTGYGREEGQQTQQVEDVQCEIFNQLLSSTIALLNSLDLSMRSEDGSKDLAISMSNISCRRNKQDYDRYLNLSDLCAGVLDRIEKDDSSIWSKLNMEAFVKSLLLLATRDTTLCGLLKLLTKSLRICLKSEVLRPQFKAMIELEQLSNEVNEALYPAGMK